MFNRFVGGFFWTFTTLIFLFPPFKHCNAE